MIEIWVLGLFKLMTRCCWCIFENYRIKELIDNNRSYNNEDNN